MDVRTQLVDLILAAPEFPLNRRGAAILVIAIGRWSVPHTE